MHIQTGKWKILLILVSPHWYKSNLPQEAYEPSVDRFDQTLAKRDDRNWTSLLIWLITKFPPWYYQGVFMPNPFKWTETARNIRDETLALLFAAIKNKSKLSTNFQLGNKEFNFWTNPVMGMYWLSFCFMAKLDSY